MRLVNALERLNRKERYILVSYAVGRPEFELGDDFRRHLSQSSGLEIPPSGVFVAMDYHLDWLYAALMWHAGRVEPGVPCVRDSEPTITASQADIDLIVAFERGTTAHVLLVEAKGYSGWSNRQMEKKAERLHAIFGSDGESFPGVEPHLILAGPKPSSGLKTGRWPRWMQPGERTRFLELPDPGERFKVTRCDDHGGATSENWTHWKLDATTWK